MWRRTWALKLKSQSKKTSSHLRGVSSADFWGQINSVRWRKAASNVTLGTSLTAGGAAWLLIPLISAHPFGVISNYVLILWAHDTHNCKAVCLCECFVYAVAYMHANVANSEIRIKRSKLWKQHQAKNVYLNLISSLLEESLQKLWLHLFLWIAFQLTLPGLQLKRWTLLSKPHHRWDGEQWKHKLTQGVRLILHFLHYGLLLSMHSLCVY